MINPEDRKYLCLECGYISLDEEDALEHQVYCDNPMELIHEQ